MSAQTCLHIVKALACSLVASVAFFATSEARAGSLWSVSLPGITGVIKDVAVGNDGSFVVIERVRRPELALDPLYLVRFSPDGQSLWRKEINTPAPGGGFPRLSMMPSGDILIAEKFRIFKVSADGAEMTAFAGNGQPATSEPSGGFPLPLEGGPALDRKLLGVTSLAVNSAGEVFFADRIADISGAVGDDDGSAWLRKVSADQGWLSTVTFLSALFQSTVHPLADPDTDESECKGFTALSSTIDDDVIFSDASWASKIWRLRKGSSKPELFVDLKSLGLTLPSDLVRDRDYPEITRASIGCPSRLAKQPNGDLVFLTPESREGFPAIRKISPQREVQTLVRGNAQFVSTFPWASRYMASPAGLEPYRGLPVPSTSVEIPLPMYKGDTAMAAKAEGILVAGPAVFFIGPDDDFELMLVDLVNRAARGRTRSSTKAIEKLRQLSNRDAIIADLHGQRAASGQPASGLGLLPSELIDTLSDYRPDARFRARIAYETARKFALVEPLKDKKRGAKRAKKEGASF